MMMVIRGEKKRKTMKIITNNYIFILFYTFEKSIAKIIPFEKSIAKIEK